MGRSLQTTVIQLAVILFSLTLHEVSHAYVAYLLGDPTARSQRRLTLNPLAHIDPFGTILLPLFLALSGSGVVIGWAKAVPYNPFYFRNPKRGTMLVALSGPVMNLAIAVVAAGFSRVAWMVPILHNILIITCVTNVILAVFNLVPIPPLDGSRVVTGLLPDRLVPGYLSVEPYGFIAIFLLLYAGLWDHALAPIADMVLRILLV